MFKRVLILCTAIYSQMTWAFFCPNNFQQINLGDSVEAVTKACGKPTREESKEVTVDNTPQEWRYYLPIPAGTNLNVDSPGTIATQFTFDANGKVINIAVNGMSIGGTTVCGSTIQIGATREQIQSLCGKPSFINKQEQKGQPESTKLVEYYYGNSKLTFENGKLKSRQ